MFIDEKSELNFYRKIFKKINAAIYTVNMEPYTIEWINESRVINDVIGITREQVLDQGEYIAAQLMANPDFSESVTLAVEKFKESPDIAWAGVYRIKHINGDFNWVVYAISTLESDENGVPIKAVCVAIDPSNLHNTPETLKDFIKHLNKLRFEPILGKLTDRQQEVLCLLMESNSEEDIAEKIGISKYTVRDHKKSLYKKLDCTNSKELFAKAHMYGLR